MTAFFVLLVARQIVRLHHNQRIASQWVGAVRPRLQVLDVQRASGRWGRLDGWRLSWQGSNGRLCLNRLYLLAGHVQERRVGERGVGVDQQGSKAAKQYFIITSLNRIIKFDVLIFSLRRFSSRHNRGRRRHHLKLPLPRVA